MRGKSSDSNTMGIPLGQANHLAIRSGQGHSRYCKAGQLLLDKAIVSASAHLVPEFQSLDYAMSMQLALHPCRFGSAAPPDDRNW